MSTASPTPGPASAPLVVRTVALDLDHAVALVDLLPEPATRDDPQAGTRDDSRGDLVAWLHRGEGFVGWGEAARVVTEGPDRFAEADAWWADVVARAVVRDEVGMPGTGLVACGSFAFADRTAARSGLVVPSVVVGRRGETAWLTTIGPGRLDGAPTPVGPTAPPPAPQGLVYDDASAERWPHVVAEAVRRIGAGEVEKVVLAREQVATATDDIDVRWPLRRLAADYPMCWTFHVDGLVGASPEMLVRRDRGLVTSRVLAGTIRRTGDDAHDLALAATLARSSKDLEEHEYAVRSVAEALAPHCATMNVPEAPFVLHLPNVMHLATDLAGVVPESPDGRRPVSSLMLASGLHPSAAVGGTPRSAAVPLIAEIEGLDRGRYAGPVGWMDAHGDGEWAIALRSAEVTGRRVRLFAGCGIVADSDPAAELAESQAKLLPVRGALAAD